MKVKTFQANSEKEILRQIRSEFGPDAVILNTKSVFVPENGDNVLEVVAAVDCHGSRKFSNGALAGVVAAGDTADYDNSTKDASNIDAIKSRLDNMSAMVEKLNENLKGRGDDRFKNIFSHFSSKGIDQAITSVLIEDIKDSIKVSRWNDRDLIERHLRSSMEKMISVSNPIAVESGVTKYIALVGPTGVGKTTTLAKLASNYALTQTNKVALISIDTFRIGAVDQLKIYGDLLNIPVIRVANSDEMKKAVSKLKDKELVLIDTIGYSQYNTKEISSMNEILGVLPNLECNLVISANSDPFELTNIIDNFKVMNPVKIIFTKMDEARRFGAIVNAVYFSDLEISYITNGQKVPEDIVRPISGELAKIIIGDINYDGSGRDAEAFAQSASTYSKF